MPATLALLKGRASYLCLYRLVLARTEAQLPDRWAVRQLARVETWAQATKTGDMAEIEGLVVVAETAQDEGAQDPPMSLEECLQQLPQDSIEAESARDQRVMDQWGWGASKPSR